MLKVPYYGFRVIHTKSHQDLPQISNLPLGFEIERNLLDNKLIEAAKRIGSIEVKLGSALDAVNQRNEYA